MRKILIINLLLLSKFVCFSQLKTENFLLIDSLNKNILVDNGESGIKGFNLLSTKFKYQDNLSFSYFNKSINYCCNYYELTDIPKDWNIITVKDIVAHMDDKNTGFRFNTKKLFFVLYDSERKIYKAYQVDIVGWPRPD
jgi:hypothetical protein